jgi:hypothetical protein
MAEAREAVKSVLHTALLCFFIRLCPFGGASGTLFYEVSKIENGLYAQAV